MEQNTQTMDEYISMYDKPKRGKGKPSGSKYTDEEKRTSKIINNEILLTILTKNGNGQGWKKPKRLWFKLTLSFLCYLFKIPLKEHHQYYISIKTEIYNPSPDQKLQGIVLKWYV